MRTFLGLIQRVPLFAAVLWVMPGLASGGDAIWQAGTGDWDIGGNWSGGVVPASGDNVFINNAGVASLPGGVSGEGGVLYIGYTDTGFVSISGGALTSTAADVGTFLGSQGEVTVSSGSWTNASDLVVGLYGAGTVTISGGTVSAGNGYLGLNAESQGTATVSGGSWTNSAATIIGQGGTGDLTINGGTLSDIDGYIGLESGSQGTVTVESGTWSNTGGVNVGHAGTGTLDIKGGLVSAINGVLGFEDTGAGTATVSGGSWTNSAALIVGQSGTGTLNITGGEVSAVLSYAGYNAGSQGTINVSGGTLSSSEYLEIGAVGTGTLNLTSTGQVTVGSGAGTLYLAYFEDSQGTLNIGSETASAGVLDAAEINGGSGLATVNFLQRDSSYTLAPVITGSASVLQMSGGTTNFNQDQTYSGKTTIRSGVLAAQSLVNSTVLVQGHGEFSPYGTTVGTSTVAHLVLEGGALLYDLASPGLSDQIISTSAATLSAPSSFYFSDAGFAAGTFTLIQNVDGAFDINQLAFDTNITGMTGTFSIVGSNLLFTTASASGDLDNGTGTPTGSNYNVFNGSRTGPRGVANFVTGLSFNPDGTLNLNGPLVITKGLFDVPRGTGEIMGGYTVSTPGDFTKLGQGLLKLLANVFVAGNACVQDGALSVDGILTAENVINEAILKGSGYILADVLNNGTIAPGNSPGTLTVQGNFTQSSSGTLQIEAASTSVFDRLIVTGRASLSGTLQILSYNGFGFQYGQQFNFLQAGSISGTFSRITVPNPDKFRGRFIVDGGSGTVVIAPASYTIVAQTRNQKNVARALNDFIPSTHGDKQAVSTALDIQTAGQYPAAFNAIAPIFYESLAQTSLEQSTAQNQMVAQRLGAVRSGATGFSARGLGMPLTSDRDGKSVMEAKDAKSAITPANATRWGLWVQGNGIFGRMTNVGDVPSYRFASGGFLGGADYRWSENLTTGVYAGYQGTYSKSASNSSTQINSTLFGTYATYQEGGFYSDAIIGGSYNNYENRRTVEFSTIDRTARSDVNGGQLSAYLDAGYDWQVGSFTFGPLVSGQYTYTGLGSFTESGADSLDLKVGQQHANSIRSNLGGRIAYTWNLTSKFVIIPEVRVFWQHEYLNGPRGISASLDGGSGPAFSYQTGAVGQDGVFTGAGLSALFGPDWSGYIYYNADFGRQDYVGQMISGGVNWKF